MIDQSQDIGVCNMCKLINEMRVVVLKTKKEIQKLPTMIAFEAMKKEVLKLEQAHYKCAGCHICFGAAHIAVETKTVPELGPVCQWCAIDIARDGVTKFKARVKLNRGKE